MPIFRFCAAEIQGVPLDLSKQVNIEYIFSSLVEHNVEATQLDGEADYPLDITPPYWSKNNFRYFLTLVKKEMARVDLMPVHSDSAAHEVTPTGRELAQKSYPVSPNHNPFTVVGPRPGTSLICLHEFVIGIPEELFEFEAESSATQVQPIQ